MPNNNFEHIIHKHSSVVTNGNPKLPTTNNVEYGEIAVNYAKDHETISLKNSNNEIVTFSSDNAIKKLINDDAYVISNSLNDLNSRIGAVEDRKMDKINGTSSQFVKGDGSLDSNTYATQNYVNSAIEDSADLWITWNDGSSLTCDTSVSDILAAINAGKCVRGWVPSYGNWIFTPTLYTDTIVLFSFITAGDEGLFAWGIQGEISNGVDTWSEMEGPITIPSETAISGALEEKIDKVSSSTDNAIVRFDGTAGAVQNSGVTINDSNHVTAAKFITSGGTSSQVVLGDGTLTAADTLPQYEAYLKWGGKNISSGYSPIDASMIGELGANRLAFPNAGGITVEYSRDSGTTWTDYQASDDKKVGLFSGINQNFIIGKAASNDVASNTYQLRIKIVAGSGSSAVGVYTQLNKFVFYVSTSGSTGCWCTLKGRTAANYNNNVETYSTYADQVAIGGWSGYNIINTSSITFGTSDTQTKEITFTFGCTGYTGNGTTNVGLSIYKIFCFGGVGWTEPSNMARTGHLYSYDSSQNAIFPANITAPKFITSGGTSSQFVKGDGSLDSTTYAGAQTSGGAANKAVSIPFGQVDSTSTSTAFTATIDGITELRDGVCVYLKNGVVTSAASCTLNVNGLGAKPMYNTMAATTAISTQWNVNYTMLFIYNSTRVSGGCWDMYYGYNTDTNTRGYEILEFYSGSKKVKTACQRNQIMLTCMDGYLLPVYSGTYTTGTSKILTTEKFNPNGQVYYYGSTGILEANATPANGTLFTQAAYNFADLRYSFNTGTTLIAGNDIYLVCVPQNDGSAILHTSPIAFALPSTEDGLIYKRLGKAHDTYRLSMEQDKPCYYYKNGAMCLWTGINNSIKLSGTTAERPTNVSVGDCYFDTDLGKDIYVKKVNNNVVTWVDSNGFSAVPTIGTTDNRPDLFEDYNRGFEYFDTNLKTQVYLDYSHEEVVNHTYIYSQTKSAYYSNPFLEGDKLYVHTVKNNSGTNTLTLAFCKTNDGTFEDAIYLDASVVISDTVTDTPIVSAPDPTVYPYIYNAYTQNSNHTIKWIRRNIHWIPSQTTDNLVTSLSSSSTDAQYPSAKCVYDLVGDIETLLASI